MKKIVAGLLFLFCVAVGLCVIGFVSADKVSTNAEQADQLASQLMKNTVEYVMKTGQLPTQPFNPFMRSGIFPSLSLDCKEKENLCLDKDFIYTGQCSDEKCMLHVARMTQDSTPSAVSVDFMMSMQMEPRRGVTYWKKVCLYNTKAGRRVCDSLREKGWPEAVQMGK